MSRVATDRIEITRPKLLLVEGKDEEGVFDALIKRLSIPEVQIIAYKGKPNLKNFLGAIVSTPGFGNVLFLGIVRDADDNPAGAMQSLQGALQDYDLPVPEAPMKRTGSSPTVTVFVMPGETRTGMLEDLLWNSIPTSQTSCIATYLECMQVVSPSSKNRVHAYLASKKDPMRVGEAAQAGIWDFGNPAFNDVKEFLGEAFPVN